MRERKAAGRVRECHGDLHLANMVLVDGHVRMFDCLEFNEDLRWLDTANEIAFTYVDLLDHGQNGPGQLVRRRDGQPQRRLPGRGVPAALLRGIPGPGACQGGGDPPRAKPRRGGKPGDACLHRAGRATGRRRWRSALSSRMGWPVAARHWHRPGGCKPIRTHEPCAYARTSNANACSVWRIPRAVARTPARASTRPTRISRPTAPG